MWRIRNRLDQPLVINLGKGRVLHLLAGSTAVITDEELRSPEIQKLLSEQAIETREIKGQTASRRADEPKPPRRKEA